MRTLLSIVLVSLAIGSAGARAEEANILKGDWNVSGTVQFSHRTGSKGSESFSLSPHLEYFAIDHLSLGGTYTLSSTDGNSASSSLGPSGTWHFWRRDKWTSSLHLGFSFGLTDATVNSSTIESNVAMNYFISPSVALGPALFFDRYNARRNNSYNRFGLLVHFGIYL